MGADPTRRRKAPQTWCAALKPVHLSLQGGCYGRETALSPMSKPTSAAFQAGKAGRGWASDPGLFAGAGEGVACGSGRKGRCAPGMETQDLAKPGHSLVPSVRELPAGSPALSFPAAWRPARAGSDPPPAARHPPLTVGLVRFVF